MEVHPQISIAFERDYTAYDANGNITAQGARTYTHSPDNRLLSVIDNGNLTAIYVYNAAGPAGGEGVSAATTRFIYGQSGELL